MLKQRLTILAAIFLMAACVPPQVQTGAGAEVIAGSLHRVDNSSMQLSYIDPDADFKKYTKVLVRPLGVDNIEVIQPAPSKGVAGRSIWKLTERDKDALRKAFQDAMVKQLQDEGGYPVVNTPGDDVLEIVAKITALAPTAPNDDMRSRPAGRSTIYTEGAGSIAVSVVYGDSETGEVLGLAKDARRGKSYWGQNNTVSNMAEVNRMFNAWAKQIREGLDRVQAKK